MPNKKNLPLYPEKIKQHRKGDPADYHFLPKTTSKGLRRSQLRKMQGRWDGKSGVNYEKGKET